MKHLKTYKIFEFEQSTQTTQYVNWEVIDLNALFDELNEKLFNNSLSKIPVIKTKTSSSSGRFISKWNSNLKEYVSDRIEISTKYKFTMQTLKDILAHEMIHHCVLKAESKKGSHCTEFLYEMERINKDFGYNISVKHDVTDLDISREGDLAKDVYYILYSLDGEHSIACISENMASEVEKILKSFFLRVYNTRNKEPFTVFVYKTKNSTIKRFKCARTWRGVNAFYVLTDKDYENILPSSIEVKRIVIDDNFATS